MSGSRIAPILTLVLLLDPAASVAATEGLVADYQFNQTFSPVLGAMPAMTEIGSGNGEFIFDKIYENTRFAYAFPENDGLQVTPTTNLENGEPYTIILELRLDDTDGYRRLIDFQSGQSDTGFYLLDGQLRFYNDAGAIGGLVCPDTWVQVAITRDANKNVIGYIDGNAYFHFVDTGNLGVMTATTLRFFRDNECAFGSCNEASAGAVARVLIYDFAQAQQGLHDFAAVPCGDGNRDGSVKAGDALLALRAAVGSACCQPESCDVGAPEGITASDSLAILKSSVGQQIALSCPQRAVSP